MSQHSVPERAFPGRVEFDPELPFKVGTMNGREARESGLRLTAQIAPGDRSPNAAGTRYGTEADFPSTPRHKIDRKRSAQAPVSSLSGPMKTENAWRSASHGGWG